jgi:hypothetical protein
VLRGSKKTKKMNFAILLKLTFILALVATVFGAPAILSDNKRTTRTIKQFTVSRKPKK